ncbi:MAG: hypothetical protein NT069_01435 [Planctomycetota bacterium]|nr:hypothetical protein [Planctomycetota bacterium]
MREFEPTFPPPGSKIEIVEQTPEKLVVCLRSPYAGLLVGVAVFYLAGLLVVSSIGLTHHSGPIPLAGAAALGAMLLGGLAGAWQAWGLRTQRTFLFIDSERVVLRRVEFSRQTERETELGPNARAELREVETQSDSKCYQVAIVGGSRWLGFGSDQTDADQNWLVAQINQLLHASQSGVEGARNAATAARAVLPERFVATGLAEVRASGMSVGKSEAAPQESRIQILEQSPEKLLLFLPPTGVNTKQLIGAFTWNGFLALFVTLVSTQENATDEMIKAVGPVLVFALFVAIGLWWVWIALKPAFERELLSIDPERVVLWRTLVFRKSRHESLMGPGLRAELQLNGSQSHQPDDPDFRVAIVGDWSGFTFGTSQSHADQEWLVAVINRRVEAMRLVC